MLTWLVRLWAWIVGLFKPSALQRDVPLLLEDHEDLDEVAERIDLSGAPKTAEHRRRQLRDPRLLPKPGRNEPRWMPGRKRQRWMETDEARRLFSSSLRTRNRNLRDLLTDEEQLARYGLPAWTSESQLAEALGVSVAQLRFYSIHRPADAVCHYVHFRIPKRSGGMRLIMAPKRRLKALQRKLHALLTSRLPASEHAHGFVPERSVRTNAAPHVGKQVLIRFDLKDFFPSVTVARVRGLLCALGYAYPVATVIALLATEAQRQPVEIDGRRYYVPMGHRHCVQGAPTSPALCNAVAVKLDHRLAGLARNMGLAYTRYADDLTFSGDDPAVAEPLIRLVRRIVHDEGFRLNDAKTKVCKRGTRQRVTGVTVNDVLGLSRQERRRLRAALHAARKQGRLEGDALLAGKLAWVEMLNPSQAKKLRG